MGYTKLFSEIIMSTVWRESDTTRILWITMLALRDRWHRVDASLPGLADAARISLKQCQEGLTILSSPDPHSRTKDHEGRRIRDIDGGWEILNGEKYRNKMSADDRREYKRVKQQEYRQQEKDLELCGQKRGQNRPQLTQADNSKRRDKEKKILKKEKTTKTNIPVDEIVELYYSILPELPKLAQLSDKRKIGIRQRWNKQLGTMEGWETYFKYVRKSDFLMGHVSASPGRKHFKANFDFLINESNLLKIMEGYYHD